MSATTVSPASNLAPLPFDASPPSAPRLGHASPPFVACSAPLAVPQGLLRDYFKNRDPPVPDLVLDLSSDDESSGSDIVVSPESDKENSPPLPTTAVVPSAPVMAYHEVPAAAIAEYDGIVAEDDKGFEADDECEEEDDEDDEA